MIVLDSSAAVDFLVRRDYGEWVEERLIEAGEVHAPHLLDVEVVGAVRRLRQIGDISARLADDALADLQMLDISRYPHLPFVPRMWQLRKNLTASDALFVALAEALEAPLLTTDRKLASAPGPRVKMLAP